MLKKCLFGALSLVSIASFAQTGPFQLPPSTSLGDSSAWQQMQQSILQAQQTMGQNVINAQQQTQQQINAIVQPMAAASGTPGAALPLVPVTTPTLDSSVNQTPVQTPPPAPPTTATGLPPSGNGSNGNGNSGWKYGF